MHLWLCRDQTPFGGGLEESLAAWKHEGCDVEHQASVADFRKQVSCLVGSQIGEIDA